MVPALGCAHVQRTRHAHGALLPRCSASERALGSYPSQQATSSEVPRAAGAQPAPPPEREELWR
jgi:hypothetical protein